MTTNRTRAEQVVEAFRRMNPDGPSLVDRIEQALDEVERDVERKFLSKGGTFDEIVNEAYKTGREDEAIAYTTINLPATYKEGTLAGLQTAKQIVDDAPYTDWGVLKHPRDLALEIMATLDAKAKELGAANAQR